MKILNSADAPLAVGPYVQAIIPSSPGYPVYLSGQIGLDPRTGKLVEGLELQSKQVFKNMVAVLKEAGLTLADVTFCTVLLTDISNFATVNGFYAEAFGTSFPARAAYAVSALPLGAEIEIVATAWQAV